MKKILLLLTFLCMCTIHTKAQSADFDYNDPNFCIMGDAGYAFGVGDRKSNKFVSSVSAGYRFNAHGYLGLGGGLEIWENDDQSIPIFAHLRVNTSVNKISPLFDLRLGYSFSDIEGIYFSPSLGANFKITSRFIIKATAGYTLQRADLKDYYYLITEDKSALLHNITFRLGFEF